MAKRSITVNYFRDGKLDEKITANSDYPYLSVYLDDENMGSILPGHTGVVDIDNKAHYLLLKIDYVLNNKLLKEEHESFVIPPNSYPDLVPESYVYNVRVDNKLGVKNFMGWFFKGAAVAILAGERNGQKVLMSDMFEVKIEEDPELKSANEREIAIKNQVDSVVNKILNAKADDRDYSSLDFLPDECKQSKYYKHIILTIVNTVFSDVIQNFCDNIWDARLIIQYIQRLSTIPGYKDTIDNMIRNKDYFCPTDGHINDGAIESVLPADDPVGALDAMEAKDIPVLKEPLLKDYEAIEFANKSNDPKVLHSAMHLILRSNFEKEDLDSLKKWLLFFGAFREGAGASDAATYRALLNANQKVFHPTFEINDNFKLGKTVDMIIAEAMRCSRSGSFNDFDNDLEEFLKYTCPFRHVDKSQYDILLKVFAHIGAYKEEEMVLQAMVDNMIERSPEQEARLAFLRENDVPVGNVEEFRVAENDIESGQFVYEYRTLNWTAKEVQDYFTSHSAQGKFDSNMSYVVAEWSKTINSSAIWDIDAVIARIDQELQENYGDRLLVTKVKSGANSEWIEYLESIYIVERDAYKKEYRWLQFNISGENITKKQTHIMVQALYWPGVDSSVIHLDDVYGQNAAAAKKTIALKGKQNPRWNVYIESVVNIAVEEIEKWINSAADANIY